MTSRKDKQGQVQVPLSSVAVGASLVSVADPTIDDLLAKFKDVLNDKLSAAWNNAASTVSSVAVKEVYPYQPMPVLGKLAWRWPALFMWRDTERYFDRTQVYRCAESTGHLMYVLPPLPYDAAVRLEPIRIAARVTLDMYIHERGDPDVASAANPMTANTLESFGFEAGEYTYLEGEGGTAHPVLDLTWLMRERQSHVTDNYTALTRIDTTIEIKEEGSGSAGTDLVVTYWNNNGAFDSGFSAGFLI